MDCEANSLIISWSESAGADSYIATLQDSDSQSTTCQGTTEGSCNVTGLSCGQIYHVSVVSSDGYCNSPPTNVLDTHSEPCIPERITTVYTMTIGQVQWDKAAGADNYTVRGETEQGLPVSCTTRDNFCPCTASNVVASYDCDNNTAEVSWSHGEGASSYMVTAVSPDGYRASCETNELQCELLELECGQTYNITLTTVSNQCEIETHTNVSFSTRPCIPEQVQSYTRCENSLGSISWTMYAKAESYLAIAVAEDGHTHECTTNTTKCTWNDLHCGEIYTVNVIALDYQCTSMPSNSTTIRMEPCPPTDVRSVLNCLSNIALLSWTGSAGAEFYTATVTAEDGHTMSCASDSEQCAIPNIQCGKSNIVTVVGSNRICDSDPSKAGILQSALVEWQPSRGADSYIVQAFGVEEHETNCSTNSQSCILPDLMCGFTYNVSVIAINSVCNVSQSEPTNVRASLRCQTNSAAVTWERASGALSYVAVGVTTDGGHRAECNNTMTYCDLSNLQCGQTYNVSVFGLDESCSSVESNKTYVRTGMSSRSITVGSYEVIWWLDLLREYVLSTFAFVTSLSLSSLSPMPTSECGC
ncbi:hypothetical protein XENOCAPTIV_000725 [Xenoophorus captivus]|uniref:Fibronectin type-III domain-containing protein n=1 Tax=Xenoophorus captivus TaxID=1517983 RepID=A0ABV0RTS3_9TELE